MTFETPLAYAAGPANSPAINAYLGVRSRCQVGQWCPNGPKTGSSTFQSRLETGSPPASGYGVRRVNYGLQLLRHLSGALAIKGDQSS